MAAKSRRRTLLLVAGTAVVSLLVGLYAGSRVVSPADAADRAKPPEASQITVPVESRKLESKVTTRANATFAGAVDVKVETGGLETAAVVTGLVPSVGTNLTEGTAILEIAGRPVIVLAGELPMYRTLRPGMSGPDVLQLEQALDRLGFDPGTVNDEYTERTGRAVRKLYDKVGYEPPADESQDGADPDADANADPDAQQSPAADDPKDDGKDETAGTPTPITEVVYLPSLPRRVDAVNVSRGSVIDGAVMSVSGATLVLTAQVDEATRKLLAEKMAVTIDLPTGDQVPGTIGTITATKDDGDDATAPTFDVVIGLGELTAAQTEGLRGANVKVTIPIQSTATEVLAVPVAAVSAGSGGESRVEVQRDGKTELVTVELGLSAEGMVEVKPVEGTLAAGDLVVVGER